jgi:hypothetical protein
MRKIKFEIFPAENGVLAEHLQASLSSRAFKYANESNVESGHFENAGIRRKLKPPAVVDDWVHCDGTRRRGVSF